ncbi:hypothetical protein F5890DRAFT_1511348 [Lentinula detonsa]|uniref:F-box domain-containing protein n=1 Tax=Lentinula detonsa TaxID=2804962 RepID=A0AA38UU81_9AGAR|nr:hypothetical protein F5890DRAFT_1511348 [Lentinula detonsa]
MSLQYYVGPNSSLLNKPSLEENTNTGFTSRSIKLLDDGIGYLQRTLLGFDAKADNSHLALLQPDLFSWKEQGQVSSGDTNVFTCHGEPSTEIPGIKIFSRTLKDRVSVDRLPVELLREIFSYSLPGRDWRLHRSPPPQVVLIQVCTYWRSIALSYPMLWSTFMIFYPIKHHIPMTKMWLEHSGQHPLTLYIDHRGFKRDDAVTTTDIVIGLLQPHAHRWKAAVFVLQSGLQSSLLTLPRNGFPLLETLCFDVISTERWKPNNVACVEEIFFPSSLPRLREYTWKTYGPSLHTFSSIPTSLTYLAGTFVMDLSFFDMLSMMEHLHTLRLYQYKEELQDSARPDKPVVLNCLHNLDLRITSLQISFFLDLMNAPNLKVLLIGQCLFDEGHKGLYNFVLRSNCYLNAFTYLDAESGRFLEDESLENLLVSPQMTHLTELNILSKSSSFDAVIRLLAIDKSFLPLLNRLWVAARSFPSDLLVYMLEHRADNFRPPTGMMTELLFDQDFESSFSDQAYSPEPAYSLRIQFQQRHNRFDKFLYSYHRPHWKFDFSNASD